MTMAAREGVVPAAADGDGGATRCRPMSDRKPKLAVQKAWLTQANSSAKIATNRMSTTAGTPGGRIAARIQAAAIVLAAVSTASRVRRKRIVRLYMAGSRRRS